MTIDGSVDPPMQRTAGRWVTLRPVRPADYDLIRGAELSDDLGIRWRHRGTTPSPESFAHTLWAGVLVQYLVVANADQRVVGLVSAYDPDLRSGTCSIGFARFEALDRSPGMVEGVLLLVDHVFAHWPMRKLYGETAEYNLPSLGGILGPLLVEEGRLREHLYAGGRHWDLFHLALYRATWEARRDDLLPAAAPSVSEPGTDPATGPGGSTPVPTRQLTVTFPGVTP